MIIDRVAFDAIFAQYETDREQTINARHFLDIIDELERLRPIGSEPIMTGSQRSTAQQIVKADVAMTRLDVLEFLNQLGFSVQQISSGHDLAGSEVDLSSLTSSVKGDETSVTAPLAQSTPNRSRELNDHNIRRKTSIESLTKMRSRTSPRSRDSSYEALDSTRGNRDQLHDHVKSLQEREKASQRTIAHGETQIDRLESLLLQARSELADSQRTINDCRTLESALQAEVVHLEKATENARKETAECEKRYKALKSDFESLLVEKNNTQAAAATALSNASALSLELNAARTDLTTV